MALALDTLLPTPYGWTSVADLTPDTILFDELGYPCRIKEVSQPYVTECYSISTGWGAKPVPEPPDTIVSENQRIMAFTFKRFESMSEVMLTIKTASILEPLKVMPNNWPVWSMAEIPRTAKQGRPAKPKAADFTPVEIEDTVMYRRRLKGAGMYQRNYHIPTTFPLQLNARNLAVPPYVLGVLLNYSNGSKVKLTNNTYYYYKQMFEQRGVPLVHPMDEEFVKQRPFKHVWCETGLGAQMDEIKYKSTRIPPQYLRGSIQQRMELLHGLLDQHTPTFHRDADHPQTFLRVYNVLLANDICELVRSLGYPAMIRKRFQDTYTITWSPVTNPYLMPKLRLRYGILSERVGNGLERFVWKIHACVKAGSHPVRDITVDSPHGLYAVSELFIPMKSDHDRQET